MPISFNSALTGLLADQGQVNISGNNLANSSTTGYKAQEITFQDLYYQTLRAASGKTSETAGYDASQLGFGTQTAATSTILTQGALTGTGNQLNLAIQGGGYFAVSNGTTTLYTRAGDFGLNAKDVLVDPNGNAVQNFGTVGFGGAGQPAFQTNSNVVIPIGTTEAAQATSNITMAGNLDAGTAIGTAAAPSSIQVFDSNGNAHTLTLQFTKTGGNTWSLTGSIPSTEGVMNQNTVSNITFNNAGVLTSPATGTLSFTITSPNTLPQQTVTLNFGTPGNTNGLTQYGGNTTATATGQNGFASGTLSTFSIGQNGIITGTFSNNQTLQIAQVALATFRNPGGLTRVGSSDFSPSGNSGAATLTAPGTNGAGTINSGYLEQSNTDVTSDLTLLIIAQRNFAANANTVTVTSQNLAATETIIP